MYIRRNLQGKLWCDVFEKVSGLVFISTLQELQIDWGCFVGGCWEQLGPEYLLSEYFRAAFILTH